MIAYVEEVAGGAGSALLFAPVVVDVAGVDEETRAGMGTRCS
jgi:hypothetical protein